MFSHRSTLAWGAAALFAAAIVVALHSPTTASAQTKEELQSQVEDTSAQIKKIQDEIKKLDAEHAKKRIAVLTDEQKKKLVELVSGESKEKTKEKEAPKKDPDKK